MVRHANANVARRAGYLVDPPGSRLFDITEIGVLANGRPFLQGAIGNGQVTVGDPFPGKTLANVAAKKSVGSGLAIIHSA